VEAKARQVIQRVALQLIEKAGLPSKGKRLKLFLKYIRFKESKTQVEGFI
jgi:hypothetical protein